MLLKLLDESLFNIYIYNGSIFRVEIAADVAKTQHDPHCLWIKNLSHSDGE